HGDMNLSILDVEGEVMVISQFTLYGEINSGRRPNFTRAGDYGEAKELYRHFVDHLKKNAPNRVETGEFGSHMKIHLTNDGPITFLLES
ncbi:MAG: D-aminoacyl-tRNA deacylase, partial [Candidatus Bipolaricaulota bacterium]